MANNIGPLKEIIGSTKNPNPKFRIPHTDNCPTEKDIGSKLCAYLPRMTTWNAQNNAPTISRRSPKWILKVPPVESRKAPIMARNIETTNNQCGFSFQNRKRMRGIKTTYKLVMKPAFPAVV